MRKIPHYTKGFGAADQINAEEKIAVIISNNTTADEEVCAELGRQILKTVLWKFRKDLFELPKKDPKTFVIPAKVHSDDCVVEVVFDALPWFKKATDGQIESLFSENWGPGYESDAIVELMAAKDLEPKIDLLFQYIGFGPRNYGESVGTSCSVDGDRAMKWLKKNRQELYKKLSR